MMQYQDQTNILSHRSSLKQLQSFRQEEVQEDLQLLIRAHQKIRQLEEQNSSYQMQIQNLQRQLAQSGQTVKNASLKLKTQEDINQQLVTKIIELEKQLERVKNKQIDNNDQNNVCRIQLQQNTQLHNPNCNQKQNNQTYNINSKEKQLKPSQSTPLLSMVNTAPQTKNQRKSFLQSCKQQFAQQLQRINSKQSFSKNKRMNSLSKNLQSTIPKNNYRQLSRNKSEYFSSLHNPSPTMSFLKTANQHFQFQNSKTIKNIKSANKNLLNGRYDQKQISKKYFCDRTNQFNSRQASVSELISNFGHKKIQTLNSTQFHLKLNSTSQYTSQKPNNKNQSKNLNHQIQKGNKLIKKVDNLNRKKKSLELELQNQNYGIIKYRGLCI